MCRAKDVNIHVQAGYLCGLWAGTNGDGDTPFRKELRHVIRTAAEIAFGDGAMNPISVYEMKRFYERVVDQANQQQASNIGERAL